MIRALLFWPLALAATVCAQHWPQASGPNLDWKAEGAEPPLKWSVVGGKNILWRTTLPEGGQSAVTIWGDRAFLTTHRPMDESSDRLEPNIVAYCLDTGTGKKLWTVNAPDKTGGGPSIVDGNVLWGYGFQLFKPGGEGGIVSYKVKG